MLAMWLLMVVMNQTELDLIKNNADATELALMAIEAIFAALQPVLLTDELKEAGRKVLADISEARTSLEKANDAFAKYLTVVESLSPKPK